MLFPHSLMFARYPEQALSQLKKKAYMKIFRKKFKIYKSTFLECSKNTSTCMDYGKLAGEAANRD